MKQYEYKQLHAKPAIIISDPKDFAEWMVKTMNAWGAEGWLLMQVTTPQVNGQLTGDLMALGCREVPAAERVAIPPTVAGMHSGMTNNEKLQWHRDMKTKWYRETYE